MLITPNKPIVSTNMVPVKYIISDYTTGFGYWQVTSEDDNTWYSYDNKIWAAVMPIGNIVVDGDVKVTSENKKKLVGKKIIVEDTVSYWIPRFASVSGDIVFVYSNSNMIVNQYGNLEEINENTINNAFDTVNNETGFWITEAGINGNSAALALKQSKYGR